MSGWVVSNVTNRQNGTLVFWTGRLTGFNRPVYTRDSQLARVFGSAAQAYAAAAKNPRMAHWKVKKV